MKSSLRKDDNQKIEDLKKVIQIGKKLNKNTSADEKKLKNLIKNIQKVTKNITNNQKNQQQKNKIEQKSTQTTKNQVLYSIKSVTTLKNSIIVDFNVNINQSDIKFFELKPSPLYRDVFDIKGYFKEALNTKLSIQGNEKITIGQFKPDILRIVVSSNENPSTSYKLASSKQLIIEINSKSSTSNEDQPKVVTTQNIQKTSQNNSESNIDKINAIRQIKSDGDSILVKFNRKATKNDLKYTSLKRDGNYEYIFDISGKYAYIKPMKLELFNVSKIITTENKNGIRIRLLNKENIKVSYTLTSKELVIKAENSTKNELPNNLPANILNQSSKKSINKTIVLDAGHGGDDVGAVGPNKRYEKVVNLEVTKYLEAILKQRGYKVYLTRNDDRFIKVMDRTILANNKNADLFISIHTNSIQKERAHIANGIETFFLSPARSERAKRVAALENKNDIREMSESSKNSFLESLNRPRITASHKFAIDVQAGILQAARSKYKDIKDSGVREGPFWVLVGAQMPSILVELGYISHPEESRRLYEAEYQQLLALGIANGIDSYFLKNP